MTFEDASRWCLEHDAQLSTERNPAYGYATLTLRAYGLAISDTLADDSWKTWNETVIRLVERLQAKMPRALRPSNERRTSPRRLSKSSVPAGRKRDLAACVLRKRLHGADADS
jgi:hypothetical protein